MEDTGTCFACGPLNPAGLKLAIRKTATGVELDYVIPEKYEGWHGIVHGGITATILDELLVWACSSRGIQVVTGELTVRFRQQLPTGSPVHGQGSIIAEHGRLIIAQSRLTDPAGAIIAEATGKLMRV